MNSLAPEAPRTEPLAEWEETRYLLPPLILGIVLLWIVPMGSSLGLDESGNWWVVKDGVREMLARARVWPGGQSQKLANILDPTFSQALSAPLLRYQIPGHLILVPSPFSDENDPYIDQVFTRTLRNERKFLVVGLLNAEFLRIWLLGRGRDVGFHVRSHETYSGVSVIVFERGIESQEEHPRDTAR